jgi:hypothetical protein
MQKWQYASLTLKRGYGGTLFGAKSSDFAITGISGILKKYYEKEDDHPLDIADRAGQDGWELFAIVPQSGIGGSDSSGFTSEKLFYFKRPIPETEQ